MGKKNVWSQVQETLSQPRTRMIILVALVGLALIIAGIYIRTMAPGALVTVNKITIRAQPAIGEFPDDLIVTVKIYDKNLVEIGNATLEGPFWSKTVTLESAVSEFYVKLKATGYYKDFYNMTKVGEEYLDYIQATTTNVVLTYNLTKISTIALSLNNSTETGYSFIRGYLNQSAYSMLKNVTVKVSANVTNITFYNIYLNGTAYSLNEPFDLTNEANETAKWNVLIDYDYKGTAPVKVSITIYSLNEDLEKVTVAVTTVYIIP